MFTLKDDKTYKRDEVAGGEVRRTFTGEYITYDDALVFTNIKNNSIKDYYVVLKNDQGLNVYDLVNSFSAVSENNEVHEVITSMVR